MSTETSDKRYSLWNLYADRWGRLDYNGSNPTYRGRSQHDGAPFLLSLEEAQAWLKPRLDPSDWEVREVLGAEELDQQRRMEYAMRYL